MPLPDISSEPVRDDAPPDNRPRFSGDVTAQAPVTINSKGGSVTATLRKALIETIGAIGPRMAAATVEVAPDHSLVLLAETGAADRFHIRNRGGGLIEISVEDAGDAEIDGITEAFLRLKTEQFVRDDLLLISTQN